MMPRRGDADARWGVAPMGMLIFLVALALRVSWISYDTMRAGAALHLPDEQVHWGLAINLAHEGVLMTHDGRYAARMPAYPLLLGLFAPWGETGVVLARAAQALLGAAAAVVVYALALRVLGGRGALAAGLLAALDPYAIFFTNLLLTETLFGFIGIALCACALRTAVSETAAASATVGAGVLGAAAVMTRPAALGWVVLLWITVIVFSRMRAAAAMRVLVWAAILAAALVPWGLRNEAVIGDPAWLSTNGGVTLYDGQGPQATGASDQSFLASMPELSRLSEAEEDRRLRELALAQMHSDPLRVLHLAVAKFLRTWSLTPNAEAYRSPVRDLASAIFTGLVLAGAAVGTWRLRRRPALLVILWLPVIYFTLVHCVYVGSLRYRVPLMPFLEILAGAALARKAPIADRLAADPQAVRVTAT
jgi:hypothetical protein